MSAYSVKWRAPLNVGYSVKLNVPLSVVMDKMLALGRGFAMSLGECALLVVIISYISWFLIAS